MATRVGPIRRQRGGLEIEDRIIEMEKRVTVIEDNHALLATTVDEIKTNTADILAALKGASRIGMFIKKHGPRAFAFAMGLLVASGYVSPEIAKQVLHLFGL